MKIGILQTGHAPEEIITTRGDFDAHFRRLLDGHGFAFETYDVVDMQFPEALTDCDGWLVTGSKHGAYEDHPFIPPLEDLIRDIYAADLPMVGVCFGHQIIAQALGGKVEKFEKGWAVGRREYDWNGAQVALNAWHQDQVVKRPAEARVVASNHFCENAALIYGKKVFTVQPHPNLTRRLSKGLPIIAVQVSYLTRNWLRYAKTCRAPSITDWLPTRSRNSSKKDHWHELEKQNPRGGQSLS